MAQRKFEPFLSGLRRLHVHQCCGSSIMTWAEDHPVLEVLRKRRAAASTPAMRDDRHKLGLAVEGGGMRGIVSAAMLSALEDLGLTKTFDAVYACSSGAVNAAYFLVGECWYPLSIYYDDLTSPHFLDFRRALHGAPILNLDYAFDVVLEVVKPLDYQAIISSAIPLHVAITFVDALKASAPSRFESKEDLKAALRASGWLPLATRGTTTFRGQRAIDGGVLVPHPFRFAIEDGCTHILSLSTRPMSPARRRISLTQRYVAWRLERLKRGLGAAYVGALQTYARDRDYLDRCRTDPESEPYILDLAPPGSSPHVRAYEMNAAVLLEGARVAYEVIVLAIEKRHVRAIPRLTIRNR